MAAEDEDVLAGLALEPGDPLVRFVAFDDVLRLYVRRSWEASFGLFRLYRDDPIEAPICASRLNSSFDIVHLIAAALLVACCMFLAPGIGRISGSLASSQLSAVWASVALWAWATSSIATNLQDAVVDVLRDRAEAAGTPHALDDPAPRALTAAAFGCLVAAQHASLASTTNDSLASYIDRAMATITPRIGAAETPALQHPS